MKKNNGKLSILFVCMGNICRSPTAEGVFKSMLDKSDIGKEVTVDSAGTHAYHIGEPPDNRTILAAKKRGVSLNHLRARLIDDSDFEKFDYIIAMDKTNLLHLKNKTSEKYHSKIHLFLNFSNVLYDIPVEEFGTDSSISTTLELNSPLNFNAPSPKK